MNWSERDSKTPSRNKDDKHLDLEWFHVPHPDLFSLQALQEGRESLTRVTVFRYVELSIISILINSQPMVMDDVTQQMLNKGEDSTEPCETLRARGPRLDVSHPINTNWDWPWMKDLNQLRTVPSPTRVASSKGFHGQWY